MSPNYDTKLSRAVIGCAIEVHRTLGPGLLEIIYETCLCRELSQAGLGFERQRKLPVYYKGEAVDCDLRIDIVVEDRIVVEVKAVQQVLPVHEAQLLTYLRVTGLPLGLLLNFNEETMKQGIRRRVGVAALPVGGKFATLGGNQPIRGNLNDDPDRRPPVGGQPRSA